MKRYKLLKDLPTFKAGDEFYLDSNNSLRLKGSDIMAYNHKTLEKFPSVLTDWFEEIPEESRRWRSEKGHNYCFIGSDGVIHYEIETHDGVDDYRYNAGIYGRTEQELEAKREYDIARQVLLDDAEGGKFIPGKENWSSVYDDIDHLWRSQYYYLYHQGGICFRDKKSIEKSLKEHMEQWEIVRKYEMGEMWSEEVY